MWAKDRDLLAIEPDLFRDVGWSSQQVFVGTATVGSGGSTTLSAAIPIAAPGAVGMVLVVGRRSCEIVSQASGTSIGLSLIRGSAGDAPMSPPAETGVSAVLMSFRPQIAAAHRQLLGMLGLRPGGTVDDGRISEDAVTNWSELVRLECLLALHAVASAAAAVQGESSPAALRVERYRRMLAEERFACVAMVDTDGDGLPDVVRRCNVVRLTRG